MRTMVVAGLAAGHDDLDQFTRRLIMAYGDDRIEFGTDLQEKVLDLLEEAGFSQTVNDRIIAAIADEERRLYVERYRDEGTADAALLEVIESLHLVWPADEVSGDNPLIRAYLDAAFSLWHRNKLPEGEFLETYEYLVDKYRDACAWVSPPHDALVCVAQGLADQWGSEADVAENYVVRAFATAFEALKEARYYENLDTDVDRVYENLLAAREARAVPACG